MDFYSRFISYLKVLLPLAALAILSTLFLVSQRERTRPALPFAPKEIERRIAGQQITAPFYTGSTSAGHEIMISAANALPSHDGKTAEAQEIGAEIRMLNGDRILLLSDKGQVIPGAEDAVLDGNVRIHTSDNLQIVTETLKSSLRDLHIVAPEDVRARGNFGDLTAGAMRIFTELEDGAAHIVFHNGVKVLYDPRNVER